MSCLCTCHTPIASSSYCECCKGQNSSFQYHLLRFKLLCKLYGKRGNIGDFTGSELSSVNDLMDMVEKFGAYRVQEYKRRLGEVK